MNEVYNVLGAVVFWGVSALIAAYIAIQLYNRVWVPHRHRTWVFQAWETFRMWYEWDHKRTEYKDILHWNIVEHVRKQIEERPHIFKGWWIKKLDHMLDSPEYKTYKATKIQDYDNDTI